MTQRVNEYLISEMGRDLENAETYLRVAQVRLDRLKDSVHEAKEEPVKVGVGFVNLRDPSEQPAPAPIEVEMRLKQPKGHVGCSWECCLAGEWLRFTITEYHNPTVAEDAAQSWLAALAKQLGIRLMAKWRRLDNPDPSPPAMFGYSSREVC